MFQRKTVLCGPDHQGHRGATGIRAAEVNQPLYSLATRHQRMRFSTGNLAKGLKPGNPAVLGPMIGFSSCTQRNLYSFSEGQSGSAQSIFFFGRCLLCIQSHSRSAIEKWPNLASVVLTGQELYIITYKKCMSLLPIKPSFIQTKGKLKENYFNVFKNQLRIYR